MLLPESTHALFVGALLVVLFLSFVREWVKPDVAVLSAVAVLLVAGLLSPAQVLGVFSKADMPVFGKFTIHLANRPEAQAFVESIRSTLAGNRKALEQDYALALRSKDGARVSSVIMAMVFGGTFCGSTIGGVYGAGNLANTMPIFVEKDARAARSSFRASRWAVMMAIWLSR